MTDDVDKPLTPDSAAVMKYLDMYQGIISRMAGNSTDCKKWAVALVSAIFLLVANTGKVGFAVTACVSVIFSASALASTTLDFHGVYKQPDNEDYYQRADVVAIVKTLSGKVIPTEKEGEDATKVVSKVLVPIKGTQQATELTIYGGASEINAEYMAILKWDEMIEGYRFLSHDMSHSIDKIYKPELIIPVTQELSEQKIATINALNARSLSVIEDWVKETFGFQSEVVIHNDWIYLPTCEVRFQKNCERDFKRLQFMLKKIK